MYLRSCSSVICTPVIQLAEQGDGNAQSVIIVLSLAKKKIGDKVCVRQCVVDDCFHCFLYTHSRELSRD